LGRRGMEKIIEYELDDREREALQRSADQVRKSIEALKI